MFYTIYLYSIFSIVVYQYQYIVYTKIYLILFFKTGLLYNFLKLYKIIIPFILRNNLCTTKKLYFKHGVSTCVIISDYINFLVYNIYWNTKGNTINLGYLLPESNLISKN